MRMGSRYPLCGKYVVIRDFFSRAFTAAVAARGNLTLIVI